MVNGEWLEWPRALTDDTDENHKDKKARYLVSLESGYREPIVR